MKQNNVLIKKGNIYVMTRLNAYKRYLNIIKPIETLIVFLNDEDYKPLTAKDFIN